MTGTKKYPFYVKAVYLLLLAFLLCYGMVYAKFVLVPIVFGCLFAILLTPVAVRLERMGAHRTLSSFAGLFIMLLVLASLIFMLSRQIISFMSDLPSLTQQVNVKLYHLQSFIERKTNLTPTRQITWLQEQIAAGSSIFSGALSATTSTFATTALIPLYTFFLLFYRDKILVFFERITPEHEHTMVHQIIHRIREMVQSYLNGIIIVMFIIAAIVSTGLKIIGVPYAIFLGVLAGIINVIPYLGIFTAALMSIIVSAITQDSESAPLFVFLLFLGTHLLEANVITPNIVGGKVSINTLASLAALVVGEELWGIVGMILFIPLLGVVKLIFDNINELKPYGYLLGTDENQHSITWEGTLRRVRRTFVFRSRPGRNK